MDMTCAKTLIEAVPTQYQQQIRNALHMHVQGEIKKAVNAKVIGYQAKSYLSDLQRKVSEAQSALTALQAKQQEVSQTLNASELQPFWTAAQTCLPLAPIRATIEAEKQKIDALVTQAQSALSAAQSALPDAGGQWSQALVIAKTFGLQLPEWLEGLA